MDDDYEFDLEALLHENSVASQHKIISSIEAKGSLDNITLDIDLLLNTNQKQTHQILPLQTNLLSLVTRQGVAHSFVGVLCATLDHFIDPVIPYNLHFRCILEGYHSLNAAKHIISLLPLPHYHLFTYIVAFLKEYLDGHQVSDLILLGKLSDKFGGLLLCTPKTCSVKNGKMSVMIDGFMTLLDYSQYLMKRKMFIMHFLDGKRQV